MARERKTFVTARGNVLTPDYVEHLVAEAEAGYSFDEMLIVTDAGDLPVSAIVNGPGLSAVAGRPGHAHRIDLRVDDTTYEAVRDLARERNVAVSEIVREAIARYLDSA